MSVSIKIEGARQAPKWETIENLLRESLTKTPTNGRLIRIARLDGHSDHRGLGTYELNFEYIYFSTREVELVVLEVK